MPRIFISSVQKEFALERRALKDYIDGDALLRRFFEVFLFEDLPAADRRADAVYLDELARCDLYLGLFGDEYGLEDSAGMSPTHREFAHASQLGKPRLIFVKGTDDSARHPKMRALIQQAGHELIRRRFVTIPELIGGVYASLVQYLEEFELVRTVPFDAARCRDATLADLDSERMAWFVREARRARNFPLSENASPEELLSHLNLLHRDGPTHAAVLLFALQPQRFLISSEVKCAHFHGTEVAKPIPSYQVYRGTLFHIVDQAVDFVLSKISLSVGTRAASSQAPVRYELPPDAVREAIVNAVAHRDYTSSGSVQVMLFADRLEVWNPGNLPSALTLQKLREPHGSFPANPLLAEPLYLAKYIERMGTGTRDMIRLCREAGLREPEFAVRDGFVQILWRPTQTAGDTGQVAGQVTGQVAGQVTEEIRRVIEVLERDMSRQQIQDALSLKGRANFEDRYLRPALEAAMIELTIPGKPKSRLQKYRRTAQARAWLEARRLEGGQ